MCLLRSLLHLVCLLSLLSLYTLVTVFSVILFHFCFLLFYRIFTLARKNSFSTRKRAFSQIAEILQFDWTSRSRLTADSLLNNSGAKNSSKIKLCRENYHRTGKFDHFFFAVVCSFSENFSSFFNVLQLSDQNRKAEGSLTPVHHWLWLLSRRRDLFIEKIRVW